MPLDQLLAALVREAQAEADRLLAEARADAERRTALSDATIARQREASLGARNREQEAELESARSVARFVARRRVLEAREQLLERVFDAMRSGCLQAIGRPEYLAALPQRLSAAMACLGAEERVVLAGPEVLVPRLAESCADAGQVKVQCDTTIGAGFRAMAADGSVEVVDTLESRLAAQRPALAREALALLGVVS